VKLRSPAQILGPIVCSGADKIGMSGLDDLSGTEIGGLAVPPGRRADADHGAGLAALEGDWAANGALIESVRLRQSGPFVTLL
jgi:hypothetical protein